MAPPDPPEESGGYTKGKTPSYSEFQLKFAAVGEGFTTIPALLERVNTGEPVLGQILDYICRFGEAPASLSGDNKITVPPNGRRGASWVSRPSLDSSREIYFSSLPDCYDIREKNEEYFILISEELPKVVLARYARACVRLEHWYHRKEFRELGIEPIPDEYIDVLTEYEDVLEQ